MGTLLEIALSNAAVAALLALVAAGLSSLCRRPALAHRLWLLVLLKLVTPPILPVHLPAVSHDLTAGLLDGPGQPTALPGTAAPAEDAGPAAGVPAEPEAAAGLLPDGPPAAADPPGEAAPPASGLAWGSPTGAALLVLGWLVTSLLWLAWNGVQMLRLRRLLRHTLPAPADLQGEADALARRLGLRRAPPVRLVPGAVPPMVWGVGAGQRLLFPARLLERLDPGQRASLLLHELAHVRRGDPWVRVLELVVLPLYWWHPVAWWARRELREAEEQCCDAWVVWALAGSGRTYALALLQAVALCANVRSPVPVAASGIGQVPHLRRRLTMIMQGKTSPALSRAGVVVVLGLGLLLLPLLRVAGQSPPAPSDDPARQAQTDRQLEELRQMIRALKEQQRPGQPVTPPAAPAPAEPKQAPDVAKELRKAAAEADKLKETVEAKRAELAEAEARYRDALHRLDQLRMARVAESNRLAPDLRFVAPGTPAAGADRFAELERKLEQVMQEVQSLRKELQRERGPVPKPPAPALPPTPAAPPPPGAPATPSLTPATSPPATR